MRCTCPNCETYMVHAEDLQMGCVCPECAARCNACLGTKNALSREEIEAMKEDPALILERAARDFKNYE